MPFFWKKIDEVICVSEIIKTEVIARGVFSERIEIQENSISNLLFAQP